jgi:hypothetical protein
MALRYPGVWRFAPPADGHFVNASIPEAAVSEFSDVIDKIRTEKSRWSMLEYFKSSFGAHSHSSNESWAYSDLIRAMDDAAKNAPLFIENFYDGCEAIRQESEEWFVPDASFINAILAKHNIGYEIRPPELIPRELGGAPITVSTPTPNLAERANEILEKSLKRSEDLLVEGRPREAVQEVLWLLETVATAFRGIETESGKIEGKYFNKIVGDLRGKHSGTTLDRVLEWISTMHGYLSSPTGGGVRHGIDLDGGVDLDHNQARLFCNLTRSYISFLIVEHDSLCRPKS